jgi:BMFP domain-containing protein YqiC
MQSQNRLFDDFVKVMNGAAGTIAGMTREAEAAMRERAREWIGGLDLVSREEFEAVKAMAVLAREENDRLAARIAALEAARKTTAPKRPKPGAAG